MPELPEVETVARGLAPLVGQKIIGVELGVNAHKLRLPLPKNFAKTLVGRNINRIYRRAKYVLVDLSGGETLVLHLGMSGRVELHSKQLGTYKHSVILDKKHAHIILTFNSGMRLTFYDSRRFGLCVLVKTAGINKHPLFKNLGVEPLEKMFTAEYLAGALRGKNQSIKQAIMDAHVVVGVGNVYASESLFYAGIHPMRAAGSLTRTEYAAAVKFIRAVLKKAIVAGGSSLRDHAQVSGELGYFQHQFAVYDRAEKPCVHCKQPVQHMVQGGRSTYFCQKCQK